MRPGSIPKPLTIPPMPKTAKAKANEDSTLPPVFEIAPDLIDRAQAQVAVQCAARRYKLSHIHHGESRAIWSEDLILMSDAMDALREIPPAEPEVKPISYQDCANAMLMMWMDKILSDGEYYLIMSKLNKYYGYFEGKEGKDDRT